MPESAIRGLDQKKSSGENPRNQASPITEALRIVIWQFSKEGSWEAELQTILQKDPRIQFEFRMISTQPKMAFRSAVSDVAIFLTPENRVSQLISLWHQEKTEMADTSTLVITDTGAKSLMELLRAGISDFVVPPLRSSDVLTRLARWKKPKLELDRAVSTLSREAALQFIIGQSEIVLSQVEKVRRFAQCDAAVLISGETGTGKEVFARAIHNTGPRYAHPFLPINCAALPVELAENELFGHESGAFTGAGRVHHGMIEQAEGGTLFLDEIDSLPPVVQAKLLRFLQEREYRPLGASRSKRADVRIISASNRNLPSVIAAGNFRQDLFFRLNVLALTLPPLRARREDIPGLAMHFLERNRGALNHQATGFSAAAMHKLIDYDWPGNVRELENVVERAMVLSANPLVEAASVDLPIAGVPSESQSFHIQKQRIVNEFERRYLVNILAEYDGNITRAAKAADKNRRAFFELLRKHKLRIQSLPQLSHGA